MSAPYDADIEAIILDIGGVIWLPNVLLNDKWTGRCGLDAETFDQIVYRSEWSKQALLGTISHIEFWAKVGEALNLAESDLRELEADYWDGVWDSNMLDLCRTLQPQYQLGIISDWFSNVRNTVKPWVSGDLFDVIIFSAEEGVCKPDPRIFHKALRELDVEPERALFVDDRIINVEGAKQVGIHAFQYQNYAQFLQELAQFIDLD